MTTNSVTSDNLSVNSFTIDTTAPSLNQVTPVPTRDNDSTPNYTFYSNEAGNITYGGNCDSSDTSADADNNTIAFNALADATYNDCTITVTDNLSNASSLSVNTFKIDTTDPIVAEVTAVTTPGNDTTPRYTYLSLIHI